MQNQTETILFEDLNISPDILKGLTQMGYEETTPVQGKAITPMMQGHDVMVQAPTGTGKTCAFGIPIIENVDIANPNIQSLILCPTRELAIQTTVALQKMAQYRPGIRIVTVYGGERIERQMMGLRRRPQIVVATPGRMMDHIQRRTISLSGLKIIVLDEADRMLGMGFREDLDEILKSVPDERQTVLFSATLSKDIMRIAQTYQKDTVFIKIEQASLTVESVEQFYTEINGKAKTPTLIKLLQDKQFHLSLVFVSTKSMADELANKLKQSGFKADALHGDLHQRQRDLVMDKYRRGYVDVLVATDVAARGIDVNNIDAVINYDIPQNSEYYTHRIGRTGRAKKNGVAYTFIYPKERGMLRTIMTHTRTTILPFPIQLPFAAGQTQELAPMRPRMVESRFAREDQRTVQAPRPFVRATPSATPFQGANPMRSASAPLAPAPQRPIAPAYNRESNAVAPSTSANERSRIFISLGNFDNIKPKEMIDLICMHTNIASKDIGQISIYDQYSFFDVPNQYTNSLINDLSGKRHNRRTIKVEVSTKAPGRIRQSSIYGKYKQP